MEEARCPTGHVYMRRAWLSRVRDVPVEEEKSCPFLEVWTIAAIVAEAEDAKWIPLLQLF